MHTCKHPHIRVKAPDLTKVGGVAHHVDIEQLGHVPCPGIVVFPLERCPDVGTLLGDQVTLILSRLTGTNGPNEVTHARSSRHDTQLESK